jgi:hypothetical protein
MSMGGPPEVRGEPPPAQRAVDVLDGGDGAEAVLEADAGEEGQDRGRGHEQPAGRASRGEQREAEQRGEGGQERQPAKDPERGGRGEELVVERTWKPAEQLVVGEGLGIEVERPQRDGEIAQQQREVGQGRMPAALEDPTAEAAERGRQEGRR